MSTPARRPPEPGQPLTGENELRIVSHSNLFYWWPVWAVGFVLALITWIDETYMAVVPEDTQAAVAPADAGDAELIHRPNNSTRLKNRVVYVTPDKVSRPGSRQEINRLQRRYPDPRLRMARSKNPGVIYAIILLLVITITNTALRGLWSVIVIVFVLMLAIIFAAMGWWESILETFSLLDIHINLGGYLFISSVLFVIWLLTLLLFDPQIYMIFTPGQLRVRLEVGTGETAYDTRGMTIHKQRSDLFRHWILGLGSGDLIVTTAGAQPHTFDLPNVLFVGRKVRDIEDMLRSMPVVRSPA